MSESLNRSAAAPMTPLNWSADRKPTIAAVTAGFRNPQAIATSPGDAPSCRAPMLRITSTNARFRVSNGSWKCGVRCRKSSAGIAAMRSRVIRPLSKPDFIGE